MAFEEGAICNHCLYGRVLMDLLELSGDSRHTHCMPWVNYCSYGQLTTPRGGVLENFLEVEVSQPYCFTSHMAMFREQR